MAQKNVDQKQKPVVATEKKVIETEKKKLVVTKQKKQPEHAKKKPKQYDLRTRNDPSLAQPNLKLEITDEFDNELVEEVKSYNLCASKEGKSDVKPKFAKEPSSDSENKKEKIVHGRSIVNPKQKNKGVKQFTTKNPQSKIKVVLKHHNRLKV